MKSIKKLPEQYRNPEENGNFCFRVEPGAIHDYKYMPLYFYNVLPEFFGK